MNTKERHVKENEGTDPRESLEVNSLRAEHKVEHNNSSRRINRLWLWLGIIILIFILFWWLFSIGTFEDLLGVANG